jgi:hypothetical protein
VVVQHVIGLPFGGKSQLGIDLDVSGAPGLMLDGVNVGDNAAVESSVVRVRERHYWRAGSQCYSG